MKYHNNTISFVSKASNWPAFQGSSFTISNHFITDNQDPDNHIRNGDKYTFANASMTFSIGRKGSKPVADSWTKEIQDKSHSTFNHDPDDLNFALVGTLVLNTFGGPGGDWTLPDIALGQGDKDTSNNWWFGGKNCRNVGNNTVVCTGIQTNRAPADFYFKRGGNAVDQIQLTQVVFHD